MSYLKNLTNHLQTFKTQLFHRSADRDDGQHQRGSGGIPLVRKMCFAVGGVPNQITSVAMNVSQQIFLLDVVQMGAFYVSMILFASRAWDAVTDPLIGYLVSRSRWTPIGKLMPWLVLSMPFGVLSYLLLWFMPQGSMSQAVSVPWFLTAACLFETLMSCYHVPYLSLNMFLGGDHRDRDSATAYRTSVEMVAMLLACVIQGQVVAVYNTEKQEACQQLEQADGISQSTSSPHIASLQGTQKAFVNSALVMGGVFFVCSLVLFLGVEEQRAPLCSDEKVQPSYFASLKLLVRHIPYQRLVLGFVFSALGFQMSLGNFAIFCTHAAGLGPHFPHLLLVLLASATVAVPIWQATLLRIGKRATVFIGLSLFIPAVIIVACWPSNLPVFMIMCVVMGFSLATLFLLPWSMLPDVVDDFTMKNPSYKDLEPLFFSCYAFCLKLAGGLSVGISTMTLHFAGYSAGACSHGDGVVTALVVLFSPIPIALLLVGMIFFRYYPINERQQGHVTTADHEAPSSPDQTDDAGQQASLPKAHASKKSTPSSHLSCAGSRQAGANTKAITLDISHLSPCNYSHYSKKSSVKSNAKKSAGSKAESPSRKYSRPTSVVQSSVNPQYQTQRLSQHSSPAKQTANLVDHEHGSLSNSSKVETKVTWV
ncbi:sodium-dependent lysophosphatidylcholine symporter 1-B-like [Genypterus blacodes]|uniref:sodium-dependent lysophosphatidylcholine symporter 1-B-like n=1 Tax=Genypterus blacodes TaxID=154954 RepID=UPI003F76DB31